MIERLNFYDVYGYLIPGLALLGVVGFPFWFVVGRNPPAAWSSALVVLVLGYIAGHVLQQLARSALPQGKPAQDGTRRLPSDYLLDDTDTTLGLETRTRLIDLILTKFNLQVGAEGIPNEPTRQRRNQAFDLCRRVLIQREVGSYAEQFQGLYALMRGLAAVACLSVAYHLGWALGRVVVPRLQLPLAVVLLVATALLAALGVRDRRARDREGVFWLITGALVPLGALFGYRFGPGPYLNNEKIGALLAVALGSLFLVRVFCVSYQFFAIRFAETVYRDIFVVDRWPAGEQTKAHTS